MAEDVLPNILTEYFEGGWRIAPFCKTRSGYIGLERWTSRPAKNLTELQELNYEFKSRFRGDVIYGVVPPPGRYIVDIDLKKNIHALELWKEKVREAYGTAIPELPNLVVKTKSGGYHLYYANDNEARVRSPIGVFGKDSGIDIRGSTGMVIAPTSIGTEDDWTPGEYTIIRGTPKSVVTVLPLLKVLPNNASYEDQWAEKVYDELNDVIRNSHIPELLRYIHIRNDLVLPASNRDNMLFRIARLCRQGGLSIEAANKFIEEVAKHCEITEDEPIEYWVKLGFEKVKRVYADVKELELNSAAALYNELDNAGCVLVSTGLKASYYFTKNSIILDIRAGEILSEEVLKIRLRGTYVYTDDGNVPANKLFIQYNPKRRAQAVALHPRDTLFFDFEGSTYVNNYVNPYLNISIEPILHRDDYSYIDDFKEFVKHIVGYNDADYELMLKKLGWMVIHPDRRRPVATFIYSKTRGVGKDVFADLMSYLLGVKYAKRIPLEALSSQFSSFHDSLLTIISEVQLYAGGYGVKTAREVMGKIKSLITEKSVMVNQKFMAPFSAPIYTNFLLLSNYEPSAIIEPGDRRIEVFHAAEEKFDQKKFGRLADLTNNAYWYGKEVTRYAKLALIKEFLNQIKIEDTFDRTTAVMNEAKNDVIADALPPHIKWMFNNLPGVFTKELVQYATVICPFKVAPEYIFEQLRDHLVNELVKVIDNKGRAVRISKAPSLVRLRNIVGPESISLSFDHTIGSQLYTFRSRAFSGNMENTVYINMMKNWFIQANDSGLPARIQNVL